MEHGSPDDASEYEPPPQRDEGIFDRLNEQVAHAGRGVHLAESQRAQAVLALWDAVVADEEQHGLPLRPGGRAERAFAMHVAGLLAVSRGRAVRWLHTALDLRATLPHAFAAFLEGAFGWQSVESVVQNAGALQGERRVEYDERATALATTTVPQRLDAVLTRLHDALDPSEATDRAAHAFRSRRVSARPGACGEGRLTITGPETDIAALYETARRAAVAAHGVEGEDRPVGVLIYDALLDIVLLGLARDASDLARPDGSPTIPADPFERLGDPRVPQRRAVAAEILVTVPAATVAGASDAPGRIAGWGSLAAAEVRRIVAAARFWTRVEIDPVDDAILAFDSAKRSIPSALRRLIWARSETCDEVGCPVGAHHTDIDHVLRVEHGGRTVEVNLSALCRPGHQTKDDGYLDVERTPNGELIWRTRWGGRFVKPAAMRVRGRDEQADDEAAPWDIAA